MDFDVCQEFENITCSCLFKKNAGKQNAVFSSKFGSEHRQLKLSSV